MNHPVYYNALLALTLGMEISKWECSTAAAAIAVASAAGCGQNCFLRMYVHIPYEKSPFIGVSLLFRLEILSLWFSLVPPVYPSWNLSFVFVHCCFVVNLLRLFSGVYRMYFIEVLLLDTYALSMKDMGRCVCLFFRSGVYFHF